MLSSLNFGGMSFRYLLLTLSVFPSTILCGDQDDLLSQFGTARDLRSWDQAYSLAEAFAAQLSVLEKISLTTGTGIALGPCSGNTAAIDRLGFRNFCLQDGPVGLRGVDFVSVFPAGVTTAATWDRELMYLRSRALGVENRIKGVNVALAPVGGPIGRAPTAGRNWEGFGPDQYLCGVGNAESVKGLQDEGVIACAKHFIGNEQERYRLVIENLLAFNPIFKSISSNIEERALYEVYGWPFIDAVEAGTGSVMCSYQRVNEEYSCESSTLVRDFLKSNSSGGMNFRGFVVTDWFASATASPAAAAGVDMVMPGDIGLTGTAAALMNASDGALNNGTRLDEMVTRILAAWFKMRQDEGVEKISFSSWNSDDFGVLLDRLYIGTINYHVPANSSLHDTVIRRIAAEGTTLLKNVNGALPLSSSIASIGIFGNDAGPIPGGPNSCGMMGACTAGTLAVGWGSGSGTFPYLIDPLLAIQAKANETGIVVESVLDDYAYDEMKKKAAGKDVCLAFINSRSGEGTAVENVAGDRNNLTAWRDGDTLVQTVASSCSNTIVVIHSVGAIIMEPWIDHPNVTAVVLAHLPGQESGNSLVDVLWGAVNPSSKLPYTIAKKEEDYCCKVLYEWTGFEPEQNFTEGLLLDYRWFDSKGIEPRFEFGFGLSYTNFTYDSSTLTLTPPESTSSTSFLDPLFNVSIAITNTGKLSGKEVAQLYISYPNSTSSPINQLRGFSKLSLDPGETKTAKFVVTKRDVSYWDVDAKEWTVALGEDYRIWVGSSSREVRAEETMQFS
ncbi:hypothetical protein RUND412_004261 [Rhizina undulata]